MSRRRQPDRINLPRAPPTITFIIGESIFSLAAERWPASFDLIFNARYLAAAIIIVRGLIWKFVTFGRPPRRAATGNENEKEEQAQEQAAATGAHFRSLIDLGSVFIAAFN